MSFSPYLGFNGTCRQAMTAYAAIFGADDLTFMGYDAAPPGSAPPGLEDKVMHCQFSLNGGLLMASDMPMEAVAGNVSVYHSCPDGARAAAIFAALSEGGEVAMPFEPTFWSAGFGAVADRWGISWMISFDPAP